MDKLNTENLNCGEAIEVVEELKQIVGEIKDSNNRDKTYITGAEDNPAHKFIYYQYSNNNAIDMTIDMNEFIEYHIKVALNENGLYKDKFSYYRNKNIIAEDNGRSNILNERYDIKNYVIARIIKYIIENYEFKEAHPKKQLHQLFSYIRKHVQNGVIDYFRETKDIKNSENRENDIYKYKYNYGMEEDIFKEYTQVNLCDMPENNYKDVEEEYFIRKRQDEAIRLWKEKLSEEDRKLMEKLLIFNTHTQEEVAEELGISQTAVSRRFRNLIEFMLENLEEAV